MRVHQPPKTSGRLDWDIAGLEGILLGVCFFRTIQTRVVLGDPDALDLTADFGRSRSEVKGKGPQSRPSRPP